MSRVAQIVKLAVGVGMCFTFALQFFIPMQIILPSIQSWLTPTCGPTLVEQSFRIFMVAVACMHNQAPKPSKRLKCQIKMYLLFIPVTIAALVPHLNIIISLIGALCATFLALFLPPCCQLVLRYGVGERRPSWFLLCKNSFIILFSLFGLVTGTYESLSSLVRVLSEP